MSGLRFGLSLSMQGRGGTRFGARSPAGYLLDHLGSEPSGFAVDFVAMDMLVRGGGLNWKGDPNGKLTYTAPSTKWIRGQNGLFQSGSTLRCEYATDGSALGLLIEHQRITLARRSRRLDNASHWTASNVTTSTVMGVDGVSGSATRIAATAGNATILGGTNTSASAARRFAPFIRRVAGTGNLEWTLDGGSTWTAFTGITSSWKRIGVGATVTNPQVGFRIVSSGDSFDIDFAGGETGTFDSSPMESGDTNFTRVFDNISLATSLFPLSATEATVYAYAEINPLGSGNPSLALMAPSPADAGTSINHAASAQSFQTTGAAFSAQASQAFTAYDAGEYARIAGSAKTNDFRAARDGSLHAAPDTSGVFQASPFGYLRIGSIGSASGVHGRHIREIVYLPRITTDAELRRMTTPSPDSEAGEISIHMIGDSFLNSFSSDNTLRRGLTALNSFRTISKDGVGGSTLEQQAARFALTPYFYGNVLVIVDGGLNDTEAAAKAAIQDMVGRLSHNRWLYMQPGMDSASRSTGMSLRLVLDAVCNWVVSEYGAEHYVETKTAIQALSSGSANDLADLAGDAWPRSATASGNNDDLHPSEANTPVYFQLAVDKIIENGW